MGLSIEFLSTLITQSFEMRETLEQAARGAKAGGFSAVQSAPILYTRYPETNVGKMGGVLSNVWNDTILPQSLTEALQKCLTRGGVRAYSDEGITAEVQSIFPTPSANFAQPAIQTTGCSVRTGPGTKYNSTYGSSWIMHIRGSSYFEITFGKYLSQFTALKKSTLKLTHLTSAPGPCYISIVINGKTYKSSYMPPSHGWVYDGFDVSPFIIEGTNTLRLSLLNNAATNYWLNHFSMVYSG